MGQKLVQDREEDKILGMHGYLHYYLTLVGLHMLTPAFSTIYMHAVQTGYKTEARVTYN